MSKLAKSRLNSTWTPLNNEDANSKIFNERRVLVRKWFEKWNDSQRMKLLEELLAQCNGHQLDLTNVVMSRHKPVMYSDFTRSFSRVLSLYVFSFLDPRSLCRCAQVSWHWKMLVEVDQLWMPKCLKLGWMLSFSPSIYESGMWKRLYIENMIVMKTSFRPSSKSLKLDTSGLGEGRSVLGSARPGSSRPVSGRRPPWKGTDPAPKDTWRHNYLDNDDEIEKVNKLRKRGAYGAEADVIQRRARNKVNSGQAITRRSNSLTRSKPPVADRPSWASGVYATSTVQLDTGRSGAASRAGGLV